MDSARESGHGGRRIPIPLFAFPRVSTRPRSPPRGRDTALENARGASGVNPVTTLSPALSIASGESRGVGERAEPTPATTKPSRPFPPSAWGESREREAALPGTETTLSRALPLMGESREGEDVASDREITLSCAPPLMEESREG